MRTPRNRIKGMLRQMFLRSTERSECLKRDNYSCVECGIKQSKKKGRVVKVEVHHVDGIKMWDDVIELICDELLCDISKLQTLCKECHDDKR